MICLVFVGTDVMEHIKENIKDRLDLGLHWVFGEYSLRQGFLSKALPVIHESPTERLNELNLIRSWKLCLTKCVHFITGMIGHSLI